MKKNNPTTTLWFVQHCTNNLGVWNRSWHATEAEAKAWYDEFLAEHNGVARIRDDDLASTWGDCYTPDHVDVVLTPEGVLEFAQNYAVDEA